MPKKWRRDERRRLAQEEAKRVARLRTPSMDDGHPSWQKLVSACTSNEDTTVATSTESVTIAAGITLDLPVPITTVSAVVHYRFKVAEMDIDLSAVCIPSLPTETSKTSSTKILLNTVSLNAETGWYRGSFVPELCGTCTFRLSNDYSFFNSKEVLFEITVRDDVSLMSQWNVKMEKFRTVQTKLSTASEDTAVPVLLQELKEAQLELEKIVCDAGSACLRPETRAEMFVTRSALELEEFEHRLTKLKDQKEKNRSTLTPTPTPTTNTSSHGNQNNEGESNAVAKYLHCIHFLPTRSMEWWKMFNIRVQADQAAWKMSAMRGMSIKRGLSSPASSYTSTLPSSSVVACTPERVIAFFKSKHVFASPYEHVGAALSQRATAAALSSNSASSRAVTSTALPIHLELLQRIAPSSSSLASLLRTYESVSTLLEDSESLDTRLKSDASLLNGQILYVMQILADLSFDPNGQNNLKDVANFRVSVSLLRYVACVVYRWCVESLEDNAHMMDAEDWKEKCSVILLQTFNVDDAGLVIRMAKTLTTHVNQYCAHPICTQLEECANRSIESCVVWQNDMREKCWATLCMLLERPSAGIPALLLFKCGDASMLRDRV